MRSPATSVGRARDVDRRAAFLDVGNFPFLVDYERRAVGDAPLRHQHTVSFGCLARREIAENRKGETELLGKFTLGGGIIGADSEDLRVSPFKF